MFESFYEAPRQQVAQAVGWLPPMRNVIVVDMALLLRSIAVHEDNRLDYAEAYLGVCAETSDVARVNTFDRAVGRIAVEPVEPVEPVDPVERVERVERQEIG